MSKIIPIKYIILEEFGANNSGFVPSGASKQLGDIMKRHSTTISNRVEKNTPNLNSRNDLHNTSNDTLRTQGYKANSESRGLNAQTNAQKVEIQQNKQNNLN